MRWFINKKKHQMTFNFILSSPTTGGRRRRRKGITDGRTCFVNLHHILRVSRQKKKQRIQRYSSSGSHKYLVSSYFSFSEIVYTGSNVNIFYLAILPWRGFIIKQEVNHLSLSFVIRHLLFVSLFQEDPRTNNCSPKTDVDQVFP